MSFYLGGPKALEVVLSTVYLAGCAAEDFLTRKIHVGASVCAGMAALLLLLIRLSGAGDPGKELVLAAAALLPGAFLLVLSSASGGAAGLGDGICYLVLGLFLGAETVWLILAASLLLACAASIVLLTLKKARGGTRLPFLTFSAAAWAAILAAGLLKGGWTWSV